MKHSKPVSGWILGMAILMLLGRVLSWKGSVLDISMMIWAVLICAIWLFQRVQNRANPHSDKK